MINCAVIMGRLTADPELKTTQSGISVVSFCVAVDRNYVRQGEERQADFINVTAWRQSAEFVNKYFNKGDMIAVQGSIQTRNYEDKNGNKRTATEVIAEQVSFCGGKRDQNTQAAPVAEQPAERSDISVPFEPDDDTVPF